MPSLSSLTFAPALAIVLSAGVGAQVLLWERVGNPPPNRLSFDNRTAILDDVDLDGHDDVIVLATGGTPFPFWILSGRDGATLRSWPSPMLLTHADAAVASAGDMDGDGRGDYLACLQDATLFQTNYVQVRSGDDNRLLWQVQGSATALFGLTMLGGLDVDGDGKPDVVVGAYRQKGELLYQGAIYVFANDGSPLNYVTSLPNAGLLGLSLAKVGDVDRDGCDDFASGAGTLPSGGQVILFSGRTCQELVRGVLPNQPLTLFGYSATGCGDMDKDGVPDFGGGSAGAPGELGIVRAFSGRTGDSLFTWTSPTSLQYGNSFGAAISGGHDIDLDGVPDLLVYESMPPLALGATRAYSGRNGTPIFSRIGTPAAPADKVILMRPQPGSPFPPYLDATSFFSILGYGVGKVQLYSSARPGVQGFGSACAGTLAREPRIGIVERSVPPATRIHVHGGEPGGSAVLLLGLSRTSFFGLPLPHSLSGLGFTGCELLVSPNVGVAVSLGCERLARGYGFVDLPLPLNTTGTNAVTVYGQWLALGSGASAPGGLSDALEWQH